MDVEALLAEARSEVASLQVRVHAHLFNNHITTIGAHAQLLASRLTHDPEATSRLRDVAGAVEALRRAIASLHEVVAPSLQPAESASLLAVRDETLRMLHSQYHGRTGLDTDVKCEWNHTVRLAPPTLRLALFSISALAAEVSRPARARMSTATAGSELEVTWEIAADIDVVRSHRRMHVVGALLQGTGYRADVAPTSVGTMVRLAKVAVVP